MEYKILTGKKDIEDAKDNLNNKIKQEFGEKSQKIINLVHAGINKTGSLKGYCRTKKTSLGYLSIFIQADLNRPPINKTRDLYVLNLSEEKPVGKCTMDVEINITLDSNRSIAGCFAKKGDEIYWCNRGNKFCHIKKKKAIDFFGNNTNLLETVIDGNQKNDVIVITSLESHRFAEDLAEFVNSVLKLKGRK